MSNPGVTEPRDPAVLEISATTAVSLLAVMINSVQLIRSVQENLLFTIWIEQHLVNHGQIGAQAQDRYARVDHFEKL